MRKPADNPGIRLAFPFVGPLTFPTSGFTLPPTRLAEHLPVTAVASVSMTACILLSDLNVHARLPPTKAHVYHRHDQALTLWWAARLLPRRRVGTCK